jgi:cell division protease FtsH
MDEEVKRLLAQAYSEAKELLLTHRDQLELVTAELLRKETLDAAEFGRLLDGATRREHPTAAPAGVAT